VGVSKTPSSFDDAQKDATNITTTNNQCYEYDSKSSDFE